MGRGPFKMVSWAWEDAWNGLAQHITISQPAFGA